MVLQMVEAGHAESSKWLIEDGLGREFKDGFVEG